MTCRGTPLPSQPIVHVRVWKGPDHPTKVAFGTPEQPMCIYPDDTITKALMKIHKALGAAANSAFPYAWTHHEALRTLPATAQAVRAGWNVNPFVLTPDAKRTLARVPPNLAMAPERLWYEAVGNGVLNVSFYDATKAVLGASALNHYFLPNDNVSSAQFEAVLQEERMLGIAWHHASLPKAPNVTGCTVTSMALRRRLAHTLDLTLLFTKAHTRANVPLIQYVEDASHITYKIAQRLPAHITPEHLKTWATAPETAVDRPYVACIWLAEVAIAWVLRFFADGEMRTDHHGTHGMSLETATRHQSQHNALIQSWLGHDGDTEWTLERVSIQSHIDLPHIANIKRLQHALHHWTPLFHLPTPPKPLSLAFRFKRVASYGQTFSLHDFLMNRMDKGAVWADIVAEAADYGIHAQDLQEAVMETQGIEGAAANLRERAIKDLGLTVHALWGANGWRLTVQDAGSIDDVEHALHWIKGALGAAPGKIAAPKKGVAPPRIANSKATSPTPTDASSDASSDSPTESLADSLDSEFSVGGAMGDAYKGYFIQRLKAHDPTNFGNNKHYSNTKCQASDMRQPIVVSKNHWATLKQRDYDKVTNHIEFNDNVYFCPHIWCRQDELPMSVEQYTQNNNTCPNGEPGMVMYWDNDPQRRKYVKLAKGSKVADRLPCCFKLAAGPSPPASKAHAAGPIYPKDKQLLRKDAYLIRNPGAIHSDRLGIVPKTLHEALLPNVPYEACNKTLTHYPCWVRQGVPDNDPDTFLGAIAHALGHPNKRALLAAWETTLTPWAFLALEGGRIASLFMPETPIVADREPRMVRDWQAWVRRFPDYMHQAGLAKRRLPPKQDLSRELSIYHAYQGFWAYLETPTPKNPFALMEWIHQCGLTCLVVQRDDDDFQQASVWCPAYGSYASMDAASPVPPKRLVLLKEDGRNGIPEYVPIAFKDLTKPPVVAHARGEQPALDALMANACPTPAEQDPAWNALTTFQDVRKWHAWVLSPDLRIVAGVAMGRWWGLPDSGVSASFLPAILKRWPPDRVVYHDDLVGTRVSSIGGPDHPTEAVLKRAADLGWDVLAAVPPVRPAEPLLPQRGDDDLATYERRSNDESQAWDKLKLYVVETVMEHYAAWMPPARLKKSRAQRARELLPFFAPLMPKASARTRERLRVVLEELPTESRRRMLNVWQDWKRKALEPLYGRPEVPRIDKRRGEVLLTQWAMNQALKAMPDTLPSWGFDPTSRVASRMPSTRREDAMEIVTPVPASRRSSPTTSPATGPAIWTISQFSKETLPVFVARKLPQWNAYVPKVASIHADAHWRDALADLAHRWPSSSSGRASVPLPGDAVYEARWRALWRTVLDATLPNRFQAWMDNGNARRAWMQALKLKPTSKSADVAEAAWKKTGPERLAVWEAVLRGHPRPGPTDADWQVVAELWGVSILVFAKNKSSNTKERGTLEEALGKTTLSVAFGDRDRARFEASPFLFLYKDGTDTVGFLAHRPSKAADTDPSPWPPLYAKWSDVPKPMQTLMDAHWNAAN